MHQPFRTCKTSFFLLFSIVVSLTASVGCGNDSKKKKVSVNGNRNFGDANPGRASGQAPGIALLNPNTQQPVPSTLTVARGDTVTMPIVIKGLSQSEVSLGYISNDGLQVQISGNQVTLTNIPEGLKNFKIIARHMQNCFDLKGRGNQMCMLQGRPAIGEQSFDVVQTYVVNAVDPAAEFQKRESSGGGLAGQMARGEGIIGFLGKMFMPGGMGGGQGGGLLGGMLGQQGGPSQQQQGMPPQQGFPPQQGQGF